MNRTMATPIPPKKGRSDWPLIPVTNDPKAKATATRAPMKKKSVVVIYPPPAGVNLAIDRNTKPSVERTTKMKASRPALLFFPSTTAPSEVPAQ